MSVDNLKTRIDKKQKEIKEAEEALKKYQDQLKEKIGDIAKKAGLLDVDISEKQLLKEFEEIVKRFQKKAE